jgi:hypothetical protein
VGRVILHLQAQAKEIQGELGILQLYRMVEVEVEVLERLGPMQTQQTQEMEQLA